jgi:putative OmpL-like beta-barrel porin-2
MTRMKKMTGMVMLSLVGGLVSLTASAQDSTRTFVVSGSADGYYRYNFDDPAQKTNNATSFTNSQSSFELGMATLRADGTADGGKISATADLGFGRRAEEYSYPDESKFVALTSGSTSNSDSGYTSLAAVKQLYINFTPGKYITFTLGKWGTHIGYEVLDAYANRNYSMDYMFSYGPFSHTGFKAQYAKGNFGFMLGVANPTDHASATIFQGTSDVKTLISQLSDSLGKFKVYLNYQGFFGSNNGYSPAGYKSLNQIDLVATTQFTPKFGLGLNGTYQTVDSTNNGSGSWWGAAVYLNWDPSTPIGLTLRGEYLDNSNFILSALGKDMYDVTLTLDYRVGSNLTIMPELRFDGSGTTSTGAAGIFTKSDGTTASSSTVTGLIAAVYKF